jgi:hypothetical protein
MRLLIDVGKKERFKAVEGHRTHGKAMRTDLAVVLTNPSGEIRGDGVTSTAFILKLLAQTAQRATTVILHLMTVCSETSIPLVMQAWAISHIAQVIRMPETANPAKAGGALDFVEFRDMDCVGSVAKLWVYDRLRKEPAMIARLPKAFFFFGNMMTR